ncbi:MAG: flippase-like domain-containing protein [Anaerolineae bacterium]|nr:flippase-like domain-containing protein [Anaerolineae bacterium]
MRKAQLWLGILISLVFMGLALRRLELGQVWLVLRTAHYVWIIPGVIVYFFGVWARTWRWHYLLRPMQRVPLSHLFPVVCIGYMGNNIYPARAGEVIRSYVLRRREGISMSASLATIIVERVFDGLVMLLFVFIALPFTPMPLWLRQIVVLSSALFFGALLVFLALAARPQRVRVVYDRWGSRLLPKRFRGPVGELLGRFLTGLSSLRRGRDVIMLFWTSVVIWLAETVKYWFVMHAFDFSVPFYVLMLMNGVVNLATTLPAAPGYVGTFDLPGIEVLATFGVPRDIAGAYTAVLHAALWLPITLLGAFYMWREQLHWTELERVTQGRDTATEALP